MEKSEIFLRIKEYMVAIALEADLQNDLDLDSIDAVDLIVKLQELTGQKIKPEEFKTVRTVGDVVNRIHDLTNAKTG